MSNDSLKPDKHDLALNLGLTYPIISTMHSTVLRIKKTNQILRCGDARELDWIADESVHLVVTSPPYWTLKEYPRHKAQLGFISDYEQFHNELDRVWRHCMRVLVPGGRIVCVVGDASKMPWRSNETVNFLYFQDLHLLLLQIWPRYPADSARLIFQPHC